MTTIPRTSISVALQTSMLPSLPDFKIVPLFGSIVSWAGRHPRDRARQGCVVRCSRAQQASKSAPTVSSVAQCTAAHAYATTAFSSLSGSLSCWLLCGRSASNTMMVPAAPGRSSRKTNLLYATVAFGRPLCVPCARPKSMVAMR